jgi:hypothetical protein
MKYNNNILTNKIILNFAKSTYNFFLLESLSHIIFIL